MPNSEQKFQIRIQVTQDLERVVSLFQNLPVNKSWKFTNIFEQRLTL